MVEAKHEFIDDNPYLVYTSQDTIVHSDKADASIDDIAGGGELVDIYVFNFSEDATLAALKVNGISYMTGYDNRNPVYTPAEITEITAKFSGDTVNGATAKVPAGSKLLVSVNYDGNYDVKDLVTLYNFEQAPTIGVGVGIQALIALAKIPDFYSVSMFAVTLHSV